MSIFSKIGSFFKTAAVKVSHAFLVMFKQYAAEAAPGIAALLKSELGKFAITVVSQLSVENITNSLKRDTAIKQIEDQALKLGIETKTSLIALLVEAAVAVIKGHITIPQ